MKYAGPEAKISGFESCLCHLLAVGKLSNPSVS